MSVDMDIFRTLDLKSELPSEIPVLRVEAEDYTDATGEPSLRILAVLDESVEVEKVGGKAVREFKSALRQSLRNHGITRFPYIFFAKPSELAETDEY